MAILSVSLCYTNLLPCGCPVAFTLPMFYCVLCIYRGSTLHHTWCVQKRTTGSQLSSVARNSTLQDMLAWMTRTKVRENSKPVSLSLLSCCFLRQESLLRIVSLHSGVQIYTGDILLGVTLRLVGKQGFFWKLYFMKAQFRVSVFTKGSPRYLKSSNTP